MKQVILKVFYAIGFLYGAVTEAIKILGEEIRAKWNST